MSDNSINAPAAGSGQSPGRMVFWCALVLVIVGLLNVTPAIPGWDQLWKSVTGYDGFKIRRFHTEWLYPIAFLWMMLIVVLKHSIWRSWQARSQGLSLFGLFMDIALLVSAFAISLTYLIENEAICLIDRINGDRARLIAESLASAKEFAESLGLSAPTTDVASSSAASAAAAWWPSRCRRIPEGATGCG